MAEVVEGGREELEETEKTELTLGCSSGGDGGWKCAWERQQEKRRVPGDACVCYLVSLVLVVLEAKKTRRSKKRWDEMRWKRRKALGRFTSVSDSCRGGKQCGEKAEIWRFGSEIDGTYGTMSGSRKIHRWQTDIAEWTDVSFLSPSKYVSGTTKHRF